MAIRLGPEIHGYSSSLRPGYDDVRLHIGRASSYGDNRRIVSFKLFGVDIIVTDQDRCEIIHMLWELDDRHALMNCLKSTLFDALKENPQYLVDFRKEEFERGKQEGRREKAREIRAVLEE